MSFKDELSVARIDSPELREKALDVMAEVYTGEKGWVDDREKLLPREDIQSDKVTWFSVNYKDQMVGVTRVLYEIPIELYKAYGFKLTVGSINVEEFVKNNKIAEVGRFAVLPKYRRKIMIAALLMRASGREALDRGFTHFITDVFESDPNTPHGFHERVLGFQEVATHDVGELKSDSRRITMLLDLRHAEKHLKGRKGWFFKFITEEWKR